MGCVGWQSIDKSAFFEAHDENTRSTLVILPIGIPQIMKFRCTVDNDVGTDEMIARLYQM